MKRKGVPLKSLHLIESSILVEGRGTEKLVGSTDNANKDDDQDEEKDR